MRAFLARVAYRVAIWGCVAVVVTLIRHFAR